MSEREGILWEREREVICVCEREGILCVRESILCDRGGILCVR